MDRIHFKINKMKKSEDFDLKCPKDFDEDFRLKYEKVLEVSRWKVPKASKIPRITKLG